MNGSSMQFQGYFAGIKGLNQKYYNTFASRATKKNTTWEFYFTIMTRVGLFNRNRIQYYVILLTREE